jgi:hypothetical protein
MFSLPADSSLESLHFSRIRKASEESPLCAARQRESGFYKGIEHMYQQTTRTGTQKISKSHIL